MSSVGVRASAEEDDASCFEHEDHYTSELSKKEVAFYY